MLRVDIRGAKEIARALGDNSLLDRILRPGFEHAAIIVESDARSDVHRVTGKLQGSLGHFIQGKGASLEAHIGPQPGFDSPRHYTKAMTSHWKTPRDGTNKGDPRDYGQYEEGSPNDHPFLEPALTNNEGPIEDAIIREAERQLKKMRGA